MIIQNPGQEIPVEIFISYARKDKGLCELLKAHLAPLEHLRLIALSDDSSLVAGDDWEQQIDEQLRRCRLVLLLVSCHFYSSAYISEVELVTALGRHAAGEARIIPILLRPVDWEGTTVSALQALPSNGRAVTEWNDRHQAFRDVVRGIRTAVTRTGARTEAAGQSGSSRGSYFLNHTSFLRKEEQAKFRSRTGVPLDHYDIRVVLDAEYPELLDNVVRVEYRLDPTYPEPVRVREADPHRQTKFLLKELANGEYLLRARVFL
jgi:hypothetical protein